VVIAVILLPKNIENPKIIRKIPPTVKIMLWYLLNSCDRNEAPNPIGRKTVKIPRKNINVIKNILYFSLKMFAKYDGKRTVIQHGAKSAATPATNAATSDVPTSISI